MNSTTIKGVFLILLGMLYLILGGCATAPEDSTVSGFLSMASKAKTTCKQVSEAVITCTDGSTPTTEEYTLTIEKKSVKASNVETFPTF